MTTRGRNRTGVILFFNQAEGYGFIKVKNSPDVYVNELALSHAHFHPTQMVSGATVRFRVGGRRRGKRLFAAQIYAIRWPRSKRSKRASVQ